MGLGTKIKDALSVEHESYPETPQPPGSYPHDQTGKHSDGRDYVEERGTAVDKPGATGSHTGNASSGLAGSPTGNTSSGLAGSHPGGTAGLTGKHDTTDPLVGSGPGRADAAAAGTGASAGHNKLHKAGDPRGLEGSQHNQQLPQEHGIAENRLHDRTTQGHRQQDSDVEVGQTERVPEKVHFAGQGPQSGPGGADQSSSAPYWGDVQSRGPHEHLGQGVGGVAGAGAAGLGSSELGARRHDEVPPLGQNTGADQASTLASRDLPDRTRHEQNTLGQSTTVPAGTHDSRHHNTTKDVGAGAAAAGAGYAAHEHHDRHRQREQEKSGHNTGLAGTRGAHQATTGHNDPEGTHGPHSSRAANAADPRVDSDRDHRGTHHTGQGFGGAAATTGYNDPEGTHGPHGSRIANAADPRVDSDRDNRGAHHTGRNVGLGAAGVGAGYAAHEHHNRKQDREGLSQNTTSHNLASSIPGTTTGTHNTTHNTSAGYNDPEGTHGPHSSRVANAADPRVDSDRDHRGAHHTSRNVGFGAAGVGAAGLASHEHRNRANEHGLGGQGSTSASGIPPPSQAVGGGVYNTVRGAGSPEDVNRQHPHENREFPLSGGPASSGAGLTGNGRNSIGSHNNTSTATDSGPTTASNRGPTTSGAATSLLSGNNTRSTTAPTSSTHPAAMRDTNYDPKLGTTSVAPSSRDDSARPAFSAEDAGLVAGGAAAAGAGAAHHHHGHHGHHHGHHGRHGDTAERRLNESTTGGIVEPGLAGGASSGVGAGGIPPGAPRSSMLDPYSTGTEARGPSHGGHFQETGLTQDSSNLSHSGTAGGQYGDLAARNLEQPTGTHSGSGLGHTGLTSGAAAGLAGAAASHGGVIGGSGHQGGPVVHKCTHCGKDNDISRYFQKATGAGGSQFSG